MLWVCNVFENHTGWQEFIINSDYLVTMIGKRSKSILGWGVFLTFQKTEIVIRCASEEIATEIFESFKTAFITKKYSSSTHTFLSPTEGNY